MQRWALEERLVTLVQAHIDDTQDGNDTSYTCHALTMAHGDFVYWKGFCELLDALKGENAPFVQTVQALFDVFSLSVLHSPHHVSLAHALPLTTVQQRLLRQANDAAVEKLASDHLADVIDGYGFTEYELDSALARSDKTPYEALFEEGAKHSEMSGSGMSHLWPMMVDTRMIAKRIDAETADTEDRGRAKL